MLFVLPLLIFPWANLAFELPKVLGLYLFSVLLLISCWFGKFRLAKLTSIHLLLFWLFAWLVFVSLLGVSFEQSFWGSYFRREGLLTWASYLIVFMVSGAVFTKETVQKKVSIAVVASACIVSFLGIVQFVLAGYLSIGNSYLYNGRIVSTFGQPNFLGTFLAMSLPFFWHLSFRRGLLVRFALWIGGLIVAIGLICTASRSAYLGFFVIALFWGFFHRKSFFFATAIMVGFVALIIFLFPFVLQEQWRRAEFDLGKHWTAENRGLIFLRSFDLILKRPIAGYGVESYGLIFQSVVRPSDLGLREIAVDSSHNIFLDIAVQSGMVGLLLFLWFLKTLYSYVLHRAKENIQEQKTWIIAMIAVIVVFVVSHQFSVLSVIPWVLFWVASGSIAGFKIKSR